MSERKMWSANEDQIIVKLVAENSKKPENSKWRWSQIADMLQERVPGCKRTGKQCRQRWHNQLDPSIDKGKDWSEREIKTLFELQDQLGNKWASISREMDGRTDNNIKNFFYSSLRRAIRQVNQYVAQYKKKSNIKPFKQTILTKILNINDQRYREKLDIKRDSAVDLANELKNMLARLSLDNEDKELDSTDQAFREKIVRSIQEFNKSCKKRKSKKAEQQEEPDLSDLEQYRSNQEKEEEGDSRSVYSNKQGKKIKKPRTDIRAKRSKESNQTITTSKVNQEEAKPKRAGEKKSSKETEENKKKQQSSTKVLKFDHNGDSNKLGEGIWEISMNKSEPKMKKRKSEAELLADSSPLTKKRSSKMKVQSKSSFERDLMKKSCVSYFENDNFGDMPPGFITTKESNEPGKESYLRDCIPWARKQSNPPGLELFEFGTNVNQNLLGESYNFPQMNERMGTGMGVSMGESGFLKIFKQASKNQSQINQ